MKSSSATWLVFLCLGIAFVTAEARKGPFIDEQPNYGEADHIEEPEYWSEKDFKLPPYPKDADLLEFEVDTPNPHFRYYIDKGSLSVGPDKVVRYTLVIESTSGTRNVAVEGIRCESLAYKSYGFGTKNKELKPNRQQHDWRRITSTDYAKYRYDLLRFYLCDHSTHSALKPDQIISAIKYKNRVVTPGYF